MPLPQRLLQPGEEVLLDVRPRGYILVPSAMLVVAAVAGSVLTVALWASAPVWMAWVLLAAVGMALAVLGVRAAQWRCEHFTVTSRRVVHRAGVLRRTGREIPLLNVQAVSFRQSLMQRLARMGDLVVEAAGETAREPFPDVPDPAAVQALVSAAMERSRAGGGGAASGTVDRLERLAELYERGVVTRAEFESMKAELLSKH